MKKVIVFYMPVIHQGYLSLIERHYPADIKLISSESCKILDLKITDRLSRDIRCIQTEEVVQFLRSRMPGIKVSIFDTIEDLVSFGTVVLLKEDISEAIQKALPQDINIVFDDAFMRWDWSQTITPKSVTDSQFPVTSDEKDRFFMSQAVLQAGGSSDVWRHVGAVIPYGENKALTGFNMHMPTNDTHYIVGDPRLNMKPGESPDICSAIHAEALVISNAAKQGIALEGKSIYATTFPCPVCARLIVQSGIKKVFFKEGYSTLDAADILVYSGVEIFQVK
jgi:dCMP deaminase